MKCCHTAQTYSQYNPWPRSLTCDSVVDLVVSLPQPENGLGQWTHLIQTIGRHVLKVIGAGPAAEEDPDVASHGIQHLPRVWDGSSERSSEPLSQPAPLYFFCGSVDKRECVWLIRWRELRRSLASGPTVAAPRVHFLQDSHGYVGQESQRAGLTPYWERIIYGNGITQSGD